MKNIAQEIKLRKIYGFDPGSKVNNRLHVSSHLRASFMCYGQSWADFFLSWKASVVEIHCQFFINFFLYLLGKDTIFSKQQKVPRKVRLLIRNFKGGSKTDTLLQMWHFFSNISKINKFWFSISGELKKTHAGAKQYEIKSWGFFAS